MKLNFKDFNKKRKFILSRFHDYLNLPQAGIVHELRNYATRLKPPKMANNAKNIVIGKIEITVHAMDFALRQASLPSALVAAAGQSMEASTSE